MINEWFYHALILPSGNQLHTCLAVPNLWLTCSIALLCQWKNALASHIPGTLTTLLLNP